MLKKQKTQKNEQSIFNVWLGRDNQLSDKDFAEYLVKIQEFLKFLDDMPRDRIEKDSDLQEKFNLKSLVDKLLG